MTNKIIHIANLNEYKNAALDFIDSIKQHKVFAFYGEMGVGKTTFIKAICTELGVTDTINSPTFSIVNEYLYQGENTIYHFDFYRIKNINEVFNMGYEDYWYSGGICLIEWPELVEELLPLDTVRIYIKENENGERIIEGKF